MILKELISQPNPEGLYRFNLKVITDNYAFYV